MTTWVLDLKKRLGVARELSRIALQSASLPECNVRLPLPDCDRQTDKQSDMHNLGATPQGISIGFAIRVHGLGASAVTCLCAGRDSNITRLGDFTSRLSRKQRGGFPTSDTAEGERWYGDQSWIDK